MQAETVWELFKETGDIEYYLIYRAEEKEDVQAEPAKNESARK